MSADGSTQLVAKLPKVAAWTKLFPPKSRWIHQAQSVRLLRRYLTFERENRHNAALVRMPTGSGKTGIMAILANYFSKDGIRNVVIVAPSDFLTDQISDALNFGFWIHVKGIPPRGPKACVRILPSTLGRRLNEAAGRDRVYVCTTQTLYMLHANAVKPESDDSRNEDWRDSHLTLKGLTDLVLVDEGHREPAKEWAKAVRSFTRPTVLFTATPYRNDLRFFKVGREDRFRYSFKFQEAVQSRVIRDVEFKDDETFWDDPSVFVEALLKFFYGDFSSRKPTGIEDPKVIIRCQDFPSIQIIKALLEEGLKDKKEEVLAVHDRFEKDDEDKNEFHDVPRGHSATFWVHQFKLTEGLDDKNFCLIAFFHPFPNARGLVQQIGRVLRNPDLRANQKAIVFSDSSHRLKEQWSGYLNFEKSKRALVGPEEIIERFLEALPDWFYAGGRYRQAIDFRDIGVPDEFVLDDLLLPKSVRIYRVDEDFRSEDFQALLISLSESLEDRDIIEVRPLFTETEQGLLGGIVSWRIAQADDLANGGFFNVSLVPSVLYLHRGFLFYSGPIGLSEVEDESNLIPLTPSEMEKLLGNEPTISQLSLINCDLGNASVRRRSMGARSLTETAPGLNDHFHYVSTAVGTFEEDGVRRRRYVGLSRGRLSEAESEPSNVADFREWTHGLVEQLRGEELKASPVFTRFARNVRSPASATAAHLLLDLVDFFDLFGNAPDDSIFLDSFRAVACDVGANGSFSCKLGDADIKGKVTYSKKTKRFELTSPDLDDLFQLNNADAGGRRQSAAAYFTSRGVMRIVTTKYQLYADKHFYEPRVPLWGGGRLGNLELLVGMSELAKLESEKGKKGSFGRGTWQAKSIFHIIDTNDRLYQLGKLDPQVLICEDMGTELADFIAVDRDRRRIAIIHAKQCGAGLSASDFHIINSQVTKNLELLNPTGSVAPDRAAKWESLWRWSKTGRGLPRIRRVPSGDPRDAASLFQEIQEMIRGTSTQREVWVVIGGGFSIRNLTTELKNKSPKYNVVQLAYLLQSCNSIVSSIGARLKIFAAP